MTDDIDLSGVPPWVIKLVSDMAETKADVKSLGNRFAEIAIHFETLITRREFDSHVTLVTEMEKHRLDPLWDNYNQLKGEQITQKVQTQRFRWIITSAIAVLAVLIVLSTSGIHITFH